MGLLGQDGVDLPLRLATEKSPVGTSRVLELTQTREQFCFVGVQEQPVPSLLRGFSAPVRLQMQDRPEDLAFRMAYDSDPFNRWEAGQQLSVAELLQLYRQPLEDQLSAGLSKVFVNAWGIALTDSEADESLLARMLQLPSEQYLADQLAEVDPQLIRTVREQALRQLVSVHREKLLQRYNSYSGAGGYSLDPGAVGRRRLAHGCLALLMLEPDERLMDRCLRHYQQAGNMTDRLAAFATLVDCRKSPVRDQVKEDFYRQWKHYPLLLDKWFSTLVSGRHENTFFDIERLLLHPDFTLSNPNRVRSVLGAFAQNLAVFHRPDGKGYRLLTEQIRLLDKRNPQMAARMATPLTRWKRLEPQRRALLREELVALQQENLSRDLYEIVNKSLI
jgi:aminopeptidase N